MVVTTSETAAAEASESFQRARGPEQKQQRREDILAAARALALADGVRAVSLAGIAARAGIDKSALLRYFETREQIFLELTAREWPGWVRALHDGLDDAAPGTGGAAGLVADVVARSFGDRPLFCDLLAHAPLNLERNVSLETVRAFKLVTLAEVAAIVAVVRRLLPGLTERDGVDLIAAATAMSGAFWQMATPGPEAAALYRSDPRLAHAVVDVEPRVARLLTAMLAGMRA